MTDGDDPTPKIQRKRGISIIWLLPMLAVGLGGWLAYEQFQDRGPTVTITFAQAAGIEAGKTKIRLRDVAVGTVNTVTVAPDLNSVQITAEMVKGANEYLTQNTQFWLVQPEIGVTGVSGLSTLLSGVYIGIEPSREGDSQLEFKGLESPPPLPASTPGKRFLLTTDTLGPIREESIVYYRDVEVGKVTGYVLGGDDPIRKGDIQCPMSDQLTASEFVVEIFVNSPFDARVTNEVAFRNASGFSASIENDTLSFEVVSLSALIAGGVSFGPLPDARKVGVQSAAKCASYRLFQREADVVVAERTTVAPFLLLFKDDVGGLSRDAAVRFRGIQVGKVTNVSLEVDIVGDSVSIPVEIEMFGGVIDLSGVINRTGQDIHEIPPQDRLRLLVTQEGLRAQLATSNIFTGAKEIKLEFFPDRPPATWTERDGIGIIPTVPSTFDQLTTSVQTVLAKLAALPLDQIGADAAKVLQNIETITANPAIGATIQDAGAAAASIRDLADRLDNQIAPLLADARSATSSAKSALESAQRTMNSAEGLINNSADVPYTATQALIEVRSMARSIRAFADYLERNPAALVRGRQ